MLITIDNFMKIFLVNSYLNNNETRKRMSIYVIKRDPNLTAYFPFFIEKLH